MKPYVRPKPLVREVKRDAEFTFDKREWFTMAVAITSLLASMASALFTRDQVMEMKSERVTPFRQVLYQAKLDSYRSLVPVMRDYKSDIVTMTTLVSVGYDTDRFLAWAGVPLKGHHPFSPAITAEFEDYHGYVAALAAESDRFRTSLAVNSVVWPSNVQEHFHLVHTEFLKVGECAIDAHQDILTIAGSKGTPEEKENQFLDIDKCLAGVQSAYPALNKQIENLEAAMDEDLRADMRAEGHDFGDRH